jgi:hypothetical protein
LKTTNAFFLFRRRRDRENHEDAARHAEERIGDDGSGFHLFLFRAREEIVAFETRRIERETRERTDDAENEADDDDALETGEPRGKHDVIAMYQQKKSMIDD